MLLRVPGLTAILLSTTLLLTACESSEERAQKHYENALSLLEEGDVSRAMVELRNVFKLNPEHKEARILSARTRMENGDLPKAYREYLRLVEQYPENLEGRTELAQIAILSQNWEEAERHGRAAFELAPTDPKVLVIIAALDYAAARRDSDAATAREKAEFLEVALETDPSNAVARRVVLEHLVNAGDFEKALVDVEEALKYEPDSFELLMAKLRLQFQAEDKVGFEATLKSMIAKFPANQELHQMLISWYLDAGDLDGAETFLRELANAPDADSATKLVVVQFLNEVRGKEAARAELTTLIASEDDPLVFQALLATMDFEEGKQDQAISDMEALLVDKPTSPTVLNTKIALAQMLIATGNPVGARVRVEEVLADDSGHVAALKMLAGWLIEEDKPDEAIAALRTALVEAPKDANIMTLMGLAHERAGARELAGERYALAAEVSGAAPGESIRYAAFLLDDGRIEAAQAVLQDALNKAPSDIGLLSNMAAVHIRQQDWNQATRIVWSLRALDTPQSNAAANGVEAEMLLRQERTEDTIAFLKGLVDEGDNDATTLAALVETQVNNGEIDAATKMVEERLALQPEDPSLRFLRAGLYFLSNDTENAEAIYKSLLEEYPANNRVLRTYYSLLIARGRDADAGAIVEKAINDVPDASGALLLKAERLGKAGNYEGAINIYEALYAKDSGNLLLANNLASLITTHRTDQESLDRGYAIASRLRGTKVPPLQDTYGWIEYRRGNFAEALVYLEPAAQGLPRDPLVQYHLGLTYLALERLPEARETLTRALEIAGDQPLPQFDNARKILEEMGPAE
jgi:Flp pilus assembly protein TadD